ncbi:hypothetical protein GCM10027578_20720 [Spirosoma luteolum]
MVRPFFVLKNVVAVSAPATTSLTGRSVYEPLLLILATIGLLSSHLGYLPLDTGSDEPRRALVSLEMLLSGDYITPTLNGERYFNKPPLYNWLIAASYRLTGTYASWALRLPMLLSLLGFGATVFALVRRNMPGPAAGRMAFVVAMLLLTNARVLLYDTWWATIDITFGWVIGTSMLLIYHFGHRRQYWALFLVSYALTAIAFLIKGLPALACQGLTLAGWLLYRRQARLLMHPAHAVGIGVFLALVGSYYSAYFTRNAIAWADVAGVLLHESTKRTVSEFGIGATLLHLVTFPFEMLYHFTPYALLLFLLVRRGSRSELAADPFVCFCALAFCLNVLVYWTSPQVYARYLIGLLPLLFVVIVSVYYHYSTPADGARLWVERLWVILSAALAVGVWTFVWHPKTAWVPGIVWKTGVVSLLLMVTTYRLWRSADDRLWQMMLMMLAIRLGFNWLVIPGRYASRAYYQRESERVARETLGRPLYGLGQTIGRPTDQETDVNSFHIEVVRGSILRKDSVLRPGRLYIADSASLIGLQYRTLDTLRLFNKHRARLVEAR